jgi:hypothetical protein
LFDLLSTLQFSLHFLSLLAANTRHLGKTSTITVYLFVCGLIIISLEATAQTYKVRGFVYDSSRNYPMQAVTVQSTSGNGTYTNADGFYEIDVVEKDSIWFSYLNKPTIKFPVLKIVNPMEFDISLQVNVPVLKEVRIKPRNYKFDSLQNRIDYAKIFNYQKPGLKPTISNYGAGVGFDLDEIINAFRFRRNRSMVSFQQRLLLEEEDRFIDHRFNKLLVRRLTLLSGNELDSFMRVFRPSYLFTQLSSDYEFQLFIKISFARFRKGLPPMDAIKREDEE